MSTAEEKTRNLTIVFADIVASSKIFSAAGQLSANKAIDDYVDRARELCESHDGFLLKFTGDGFMATFEDPTKAVHFAVALRASLVSNPIRVNNYVLKTRIGIHTAPVNRIDTEYGPDLIGSGVITAARIESVADAGEILVSQFTHKLLDEEVSKIFSAASRGITRNQGGAFAVWSSVAKDTGIPDVARSQAPEADITGLLIDWSKGDQSALEKLVPLVERELHRIAHAYMRRENPEHTLQTTALINETYVRLIDQRNLEWQNRAHFFGIAAQIMRRILLNYARNKNQQKRGGHTTHVSLPEAEVIPAETQEELVRLNDALSRLEALDERKSRIVELRYFGGLTIEEAAEVLKVSPITVMRDWQFAKAWLSREIHNG